jgi:peptidoglycan/xylan/chitin deacetylase (PgdA/CDA1 family)
VPSLALTFDDGPDPAWTPRLLDVLERHGAKATFFPIARRAAAHPELIARIERGGHAIGLHCDEHIRHSERDETWCRADTAEALAQLRPLGVMPALWRTPWGDTAPWSVDTHDWRGDRAQEMFEATREALDDGSIVLAHDGLGPGARRDGAGETVRYVELVADHARARGLRLEALR